MAISRRAANLIWARSGARCYIDPREELSRTESGDRPIGEIAHIVADSTSGPRGVSELDDRARDEVKNLILLCPDHHAEIDNNPEAWPVERLVRLKEDHESWVVETLDRESFSLRRIPRSNQDRARDSASRGSEIDAVFERAGVAKAGSPWFRFTIRNIGSNDVVVHSIDAEILDLEVKPSIRDREHRLASSTLIMRTPVAFDFTSRAVGDEVPVTGQAKKGLIGDPFEVAISLNPKEFQPFTASIVPGDYVAGSFRLVATYWDWHRPEVHRKVHSSSIGLFSVSDEDDWSGPFKKRTHTYAPTAYILTLEDVIRAAVSSDLRRVLSRSEIPGVTELLQHSLGRIDESVSRIAIEQWLDSGDPHKIRVGLKAVEAARSSAWKSTVIERALSHPTAEIRESAVSLLDYSWRPDDVFEMLAVKALRDPSPKVRLKAVRVLEYSGSKRVQTAIKGLGDDSSKEIRRAVESIIQRHETRDKRAPKSGGK
jgi:HEAT repeats